MGFLKIAATLLVVAGLTEGGRQTLRRLAKGAIKAGQATAEKAVSTWDDVKTQTNQLVEEIKAEQKAGADLLTQPTAHGKSQNKTQS